MCGHLFLAYARSSGLIEFKSVLSALGGASVGGEVSASAILSRALVGSESVSCDLLSQKS